MLCFPALGALILLLREKLAVFERFPLKLLSIEEWDFYYFDFVMYFFLLCVGSKFSKRSY